MYLTIMKPEAIRQIAELPRGLCIVEGPHGPVLVIKTGKEYILAAKQRRELKLYLAPYKADETRGLTLLTACFDDPQSPLLIKTALRPGAPTTEALRRLPDELYVCFFDEHNRELFGCKAQAELGQLRKEISALGPLGMHHGPQMYDQADRWFSLTTDEDDARATTVFLQEDLFPSDYLHITDLTEQGFLGSKGYSNFRLERAEPGTFQELDIIYLLQRAYPPERIIHGPLKVSDGEELTDVVVMGDRVILLLQAKDSPNTPAILNTKLERKRKKAISQLAGGLQQLRGPISTIRREGNPALRLVNGTPLDIDLSARPLVRVVVVKELFIDNYEEYTAMILQFMDEVGIRVLAFDYDEFEVMTRHCPSEDELLSAFYRISKCAEDKRIYPRLRFTDPPPH